MGIFAVKLAACSKPDQVDDSYLNKSVSGSESNIPEVDARINDTLRQQIYGYIKICSDTHQHKTHDEA